MAEIETERPIEVSDDPELEFSPLGGNVTREGISVQVHIYRIAGSNEGWAFEVVDPTGTPTTWEVYFATDTDAYREFVETLEREGIARFLPDPHETIH